MARGNTKAVTDKGVAAPEIQNSTEAVAKPGKAKKKGGSLFVWIMISLSVSALWWAQHAMA